MTFFTCCSSRSILPRRSRTAYSHHRLRSLCRAPARGTKSNRSWIHATDAKLSITRFVGKATTFQKTPGNGIPTSTPPNTCATFIPGTPASPVRLRTPHVVKQQKQLLFQLLRFTFYWLGDLALRREVLSGTHVRRTSGATSFHIPRRSHRRSY